MAGLPPAATFAFISWITFVGEFEDMATHGVAAWTMAASTISVKYCRYESASTARVLLT